MRGVEIVEEIDFLKAQGEGRYRVFEVLRESSVKPESLRVLLRRKNREDLTDFLFPQEDHEPVVHEHGDHRLYNAGCRCALCTEANTDRMAKLRKELTDAAKDPNDPRHGNHSFYRNHGCRCAPCKEAHSKKVAEEYQRRISKPISPEDPRHGTYSFYSSFACRCTPCCDASRDYYRRKRAA